MLTHDQKSKTEMKYSLFYKFPMYRLVISVAYKPDSLNHQGRCNGNRL